MTAGAIPVHGNVEPAPVARSEEQDLTEWQALPSATLRAWQVDNMIGLLLAAALLGILFLVGRPQFVQPWLPPLAGLAVLSAAVEGVIVLPRRHRNYRYRASIQAVVVESGAVVLHQLVVPLHQVIYVETRQGPILRAYGLTHVLLGTIADPKSVGPLSTEAAAVLRRAVEASRPPSEREDP